MPWNAFWGMFKFYYHHPKVLPSEVWLTYPGEPLVPIWASIRMFACFFDSLALNSLMANTLKFFCILVPSIQPPKKQYVPTLSDITIVIVVTTTAAYCIAYKVVSTSPMSPEIIYLSISPANARIASTS